MHRYFYVIDACLSFVSGASGFSPAQWNQQQKKRGRASMTQMAQAEDRARERERERERASIVLFCVSLSPVSRYVLGYTCSVKTFFVCRAINGSKSQCWPCNRGEKRRVQRERERKVWVTVASWSRFFYFLLLHYNYISVTVRAI